MNRPKLIVALALLFVAALHYTSIPRTLWEYDECLYASGIEKFEPLLHHPPPPGSPVYIAFAKVVALATPDAFTAMLITSILAVAIGFLAFVFAFAAITDLRTGVIAAVLLYASPAVLISGVLPQADSGALALLGLAIASFFSPLSPPQPHRGGERARVRGDSRATHDPSPSPSPRSPRGEGTDQTPTRSLVAATILCGLFCALAIGWRMQLSIAIVPMFLAAVGMMRTWRERFLAVGVFGVVCLTWFVPLVIATGGPASYWGWLSGQAAYYAQHDADLSRSGHSTAHIALRFIAHPWGPKWLSLPLLALAIAGALFVARRNRRVIPLAIGSLTYLGFALATMDPADAVRYAIPSLPLVALLAASAMTGFVRERNAGVPPAEQGASSLPSLVIATGHGGEDAARSAGGDASVPSAYGGVAVLAVLYAFGATWYASPILRARATLISPPVAATRWIEANVPRNGVVLFELPLRPHAEYLLRGWKSMRIDAGLAQYGGDPSVPMVILADGERGDARGVTFRWPDTDAYRKLTRQHYGAVSVIPVPPAERFRVVEGVFAPERTRDGRSWRWLGARGIIELPALGATRARLVFRTPPEYPLDENRVRVEAGGHVSLVTVRRDAQAEVIVPLSADVRRITLVPERTFVPAQVKGANNRDRRTLSVMLTHLEQLGVEVKTVPRMR